MVAPRQHFHGVDCDGSWDSRCLEMKPGYGRAKPHNTLILRKGTNRLLDNPAFSMQRCKCVEVHRSGERTPSGPRRAQQESAFLCFRTKRRFNITAVWKMLTNRKLVVAWQLLEAVCPVLLTRGGIPRKRPYSTVAVNTS